MLEEVDKDLLPGGSRGDRADTVDLAGEQQIVVDISDALSEKERVKFTVHTVTKCPRFASSDFSSVRTHEEFVWMADRLSENPDYAGIVIPPVPPTPDFTSSREKLARLGDGEATMTTDEYNKMKSELEAEYLATFKKTVAMHEVFLQRIAEHPKLRSDETFKVFLEYQKDLSVRGKNKKERVQGLLRYGWKSVDDIYLQSSHKEKDEFFESQKRFMGQYLSYVCTASREADRMNRNHKNTADSYIKVSTALSDLFKVERQRPLSDFLATLDAQMEELRRLEGRLASDSDLKLGDPLRYYLSDCSSAKDLLYRRARAFADYENANKELEKARNKNRMVAKAEEDQESAYNRFNEISESARLELTDFKKRWLAYFHKNLTEQTELQIKYSQCQVKLLRQTLEKLQSHV